MSILRLISDFIIIECRCEGYNINTGYRFFNINIGNFYFNFVEFYKHDCDLKEWMFKDYQ